MLPKLGDAKVDKILTMFSQRYSNETFIAESILPTLKVKEKTGNFAKYGKENLRVYTEQIFRAPGTRARNIDYSVSLGDYACRERALEKLVPDEMAANTDDPYDPKRDAVACLMDNIRGNQENALATTMNDTGIITQNTTLSSTSQWSDYVNSDPIADIETGITTIRSATGKRPNTLVLSHSVFSKLKYHPDIREQLKYTGGGQLSDSAFQTMLKDFFNLKEVLIGDAIKNDADEGQSDSLSDIWPKSSWLLHKTDRPSLMNATFGYTFFDVPRIVDTYREEPKVSDVIRQRFSFDQNIVDEALCYLMKDVIA